MTSDSEDEIKRVGRSTGKQGSNMAVFKVLEAQSEAPSVDSLRNELREGSETRFMGTRSTPDGKETVEMIPIEWAAEVIQAREAKIKQAFIEEGWILLPKNFVCSSHHWKDGNHVPILSGAEWYQRFEKARTGKTFYYYPDDAMKTMREADIFYMNAAKKASNL